MFYTLQNNNTTIVSSSRTSVSAHTELATLMQASTLSKTFKLNTKSRVLSSVKSVFIDGQTSTADKVRVIQALEQTWMNTSGGEQCFLS